MQTIFLDMDGVIADFVSSALRALGRDPSLRITHWDIAQQLGISGNEFWGAQERLPSFWLDIEPYPWAGELVDMLRSAGDVYIATAPSLHPNCASHKIEWCRRHLGDWTTGRVFTGKAKHLLAGPGRVLIDDSLPNCRAFADYGGKAILFPQPWNTPEPETPPKWADVVRSLGAA